MEGPTTDARAVLAGLPHAVLVLDADGRVSFANAAAARLALPGAAAAGGPAGQVEGADVALLFAPEHRDRVRTLLADAAPDAARQRLRLADPARPPPSGSAAPWDEPGRGRWVGVRAARSPDGSTLVSLTDATDAVHDRRRLRGSERRFSAAFDAAVVGLCLVGERGRILSVNASLAGLLGRSRDELVGMHVGELVETPGLPSSDWSRHGSVPRRLRQADGGLLHALVTTVPVVGDEGERLSLVQVQDLTERRRAEQRLRHLALHDALTDLPSRALLLEHLHRALEARSSEAPLVAALFVDLDRFKLVNDGLGHAVGDLVLRETARRLRLVTRPEDTVARLSGDEFVVVCPALTSEEEAVVIADRLAEAMRPPVEVGSDEVLVSASIGVAYASSSATTPEELLRDADAAMYRAKQLGRRRYEVFDSALRERAERRGRVRRLLEGRLAEERLVVHYQPVVELATRRVVGVEALARLRDDEGELLLPAQFLDVAVDGGLLPRLDAAVLRRAATEVAAWSRRVGRPLGLAVNLGVGRLDGTLVATVLAVLDDTGMLPEQLLVEVSEQVLSTAGPAGEARLVELEREGVRLGLDDFGSGAASLTALRRLPLTVVKVGGAFVADLPRREAPGTVLVRATLGLSEELGLWAAAGGVETEAQYASLGGSPSPYGPVARTAKFGQGLLFGPPVPAEEVTALLDRLGVQRGCRGLAGRPRAHRVAGLSPGAPARRARASARRWRPSRTTPPPARGRPRPSGPPSPGRRAARRCARRAPPRSRGGRPRRTARAGRSRRRRPPPGCRRRRRRRRPCRTPSPRG